MAGGVVGEAVCLMVSGNQEEMGSQQALSAITSSG